MSGHSRWAQIKRQKGTADIKKGAAFTKLGNAITVAAREGGRDLAANFKLRLAVERARAANMPKDNIERATKRGTGELGGAALEVVTYEGFGPGGAALIVAALTDNRNRTAQTVKSVLQRCGGTLGAPGSVGWMFERRGVARVGKPEGWSEEQELALVELGADDILDEGDEVAVLTSPESLPVLRERLAESGWAVRAAEVELWPKNPTTFPSGPEGEKLAALVEALEESDDVQHVATIAIL